jgi:hypothetical protein
MLTPEEIRLECLKLSISLYRPEADAECEPVLQGASKFELFATGAVKTPVVNITASEKENTVEPIPAFLKKEKKKAPVVEEVPEPEELSSEIGYDDVKNVVLEVAKVKGRNASLDLLAPFGVVTGEGDKRAGSITKLKPEQFVAVVEAAKKVLA